MKRKILSILLCLSLIMVSAAAYPSRKAEAKGKYVLAGSGKNVKSDYLVIKPKGKNKLQVKGWAYKTKKVFADTSEMSNKYYNKIFKIARGCKVVEVEMPTNHVYSYRKYLKKYKIHGDFTGIEARVVIKNGKVHRIYLSA